MRDLNAETDEVSEPIIARQALHAHRLRITHPIMEKEMEFVAELPADMENLLKALRGYRGKV